MSVRSFPWFICGGDWSQEFSRRWPAPPTPPPVQPFLDGGSKPPLPPRLRRLSIQCHSAGLPPPERCGCDVSCPLEALFSACLVARATRGLMCAVCVFVYALESEIEQPGQLMEAFHFSAPTTTTTTQGCGLSLIDVGIGDRGRSKLSSDQVGNWTHDGENAQHCTRQTQTGPGLAPFQPSAAPRPGTRARRRLSSPVGR